MNSLPRKSGAGADTPGATPAPMPRIVATGGPEARPWRDHVVSTRRAEISVRETFGKKLPMLMLHGGGLCKQVFDRQLESRLGLEHRMIAIDFPGHGASGDAFDPYSSYSVEGFADTALEVLECLGIDQAVIVGFALGGVVGLQMIETFPGLIGLALTATPPEHLDRLEAPSAAPKLGELGLRGALASSDSEIDALVRRSLGEHANVRFSRAARRMDPRAKGLTLSDMQPRLADLLRSIEDAGAPPIMVLDGAAAAAPEAEGRPAGEAAASYLIPRAGPAPFLDAHAVYNHLLESFMQRMERRQSELLESPPLWYGG